MPGSMCNDRAFLAQSPSLRVATVFGFTRRRLVKCTVLKASDDFAATRSD